MDLNILRVDCFEKPCFVLGSELWEDDFSAMLYLMWERSLGFWPCPPRPHLREEVLVSTACTYAGFSWNVMKSLFPVNIRVMLTSLLHCQLAS